MYLHVICNYQSSNCNSNISKMEFPSSLTWSKWVVIIDGFLNTASGIFAFLLVTNTSLVNPIATMITALVLASIEVVTWVAILTARTYAYSRSSGAGTVKAYFEHIMVLYAGHFFKMMFINGFISLGMILYIARNGGVGAPDPDVLLNTSLYIWWHNFLIFSVAGAMYAIASATDCMTITGWGKSWGPAAVPSSQVSSKSRNGAAGVAVPLNKIKDWNL